MGFRERFYLWVSPGMRWWLTDHFPETFPSMKFQPKPRKPSNFVNVTIVKPQPVVPTDSVLLSQAREILVLLANAESQQEVWVAQEQADTFLKLWGTGKDAPSGILKVRVNTKATPS